MTARSARYTPVAQLLPAVFQSDTDSFDQLDSYLGLVDELLRAHVERLEELTLWLSPNGPAALWPPDVAIDAGADPLLAAYRRLYDELASWTGFAFPEWWTVEADDGSGRRLPDLERRRDYLTRSARVWRRRGTPRGFLDWLILAFAIEPANRPYLLEHFKFGRPSCDDAAEPGPEPWLRATLLVPSTEYFDRPETRRLLERFVETYAPAHVHVRVCWVAEDFELYEVELDDGTVEVRPLPGPRPDDPADLPAWDQAIDDFRAHVRCVLCSVVDETTHETAISLADCIDEGEGKDRLGLGRLPGGGGVPTDEADQRDEPDR